MLVRSNENINIKATDLHGLKLQMCTHKVILLESSKNKLTFSSTESFNCKKIFYSLNFKSCGFNRSMITVYLLWSINTNWLIHYCNYHVRPSTVYRINTISNHPHLRFTQNWYPICAWLRRTGISSVDQSRGLIQRLLEFL